ncbi:hypothetical protein POM88_027802 [Heracleum sosnowskyi]|uniref:Uncharacterized protein n=1 Tax=Heracleum sosnowskyi TaxID=360622 RepID=A0AAD8IAW7_9APIA|nr:hypothetical protein POM88_027802 [Heracleum sosnowskyi]
MALGNDRKQQGLIQQLDQRKSDPNLTLEVDVIRESQNRLARFLATDGAQNRTRLVAFRRAFERVRELWRLDMGLGPVDELWRFQVIEEDEYQVRVEDEEEVEGMVNGLQMMLGQP